MRNLSRATALLLALLAVTAPQVRAQEIPRDLPHESWSIMNLGGSDAGYVHVSHVVVLAEGDGAPQVFTSEATQMKIGRLGSTIEVSAQIETWERLDGSLVRVRSVSKLSANETVSEVEFRDGKAILTTKGVGETRTKEIECPADTVGPYALSQKGERALANAGATFEARIWSTDLSKAITVKVRVVGEQEIEHGGKKVRAIRVETEPQTKGIPKSVSYSLPDGTELRTEVEILGMKMIARAATKEEALAAGSQSANLSPELFTPTMVVESSFLPAPRRAERAVVRVRPRDGAKLELVEDERQRSLGRLEDGSTLFELRAVTPPAGLRGKRPLGSDGGALPAQVQEALLPSSMIQSDAPEIMDIAQQVVGEEPEAWRAAQALEMWVEANLTDKNMDVAFASALEVCKNRSGDCSEHAVFLAALCRAAGIPARVSMGLLYIGGIWGGHAWNEVWIDGRWYALDATLGLGRCDALHLAFSKMSLKEGGFAEEFSGLLENLGKLDLAVEELTLARYVEPLREKGRLIDGWYRDDAWQIRFQIPSSARVELPKPQAAIGFELMSLDCPIDDAADMKLELRGYDASLDGSWPSFLGKVKGTELSVDGRPALRVGDGGLRRVLIRSGGKVFELKFSRVKGEAAEAAYASILSSIDFDF
ncbi:MAG: transglutaminase domain-containing protein [Planctomycetes bacterium]|nr:transglutaminase domain-containing protein [Planctomycetota bacterium]